MRLKLLVCVLAVAAIAITIAVHSAYAESVGVVGATWVKKPEHPGDTGIIKLTLVYSGDKSLCAVSIKVWGEGGLEVLSGDGYVALWKCGTPYTFNVVVRAKKLNVDAVLKIRVYWDSTIKEKPFGGVEIGSGSSVDIYERVHVPAKPRIEVSVSPKRLSPDTANVIRISFTNVGGGAAANVKATIRASGLVITDKALPYTLTFSEIRPNETVSDTFTAVPIASTPTLSITLEYVEEDGAYTTETVTVPLYVSGGGYIHVVPSPSIVDAGGEYQVKLTLVNGGDVPLKSAVVKLSPAAGSQIVIGTPIIDFGDVAPLGRVTKTINVTVPTSAAGGQVISYEVIYRTPEGSVARDRGTLIINVLAPASLKVTSVDVVPSELYVNKSAVVSLTLLNTGSSIISNLNVSVVTSGGLEVLRRTSVFLGKLEPDMPSSVAFSFRPVSPGKHSLTFKLVYTDIYGRLHVLKRTVTITVKAKPTVLISSAAPELTHLYYAVGVGAVIVAILVVLLVRKYGVKRK